MQEYIKTGKVRNVFRDLRRAESPHAFKAPRRANCAGEQGKFWEMHNRLFENTRALAPANLTQHAQALGLDAAKFAPCLESGKYGAEVRKDMSDAAAAQVGGTPGFIVGIVNPKNLRDPNVRIFRLHTAQHPTPPSGDARRRAGRGREA